MDVTEIRKTLAQAYTDAALVELTLENKEGHRTEHGTVVDVDVHATSFERGYVVLEDAEGDEHHYDLEDIVEVEVIDA